uniref:Uncharacterized protein n=1 Tax=Anguilla anguilla TaxID=7936 RepID=A0A0E9TUG0_ANGAN
MISKSVESGVVVLGLTTTCTHTGPFQLRLDTPGADQLPYLATSKCESSFQLFLIKLDCGVNRILIIDLACELMAVGLI